VAVAQGAMSLTLQGNVSVCFFGEKFGGEDFRLEAFFYFKENINFKILFPSSFD
jgi:hypothetical protein